MVVTYAGDRHRYDSFNKCTELDELVKLEMFRVLLEVVVDIVMVRKGGKVGWERKVWKQHDLFWEIGPVEWEHNVKHSKRETTILQL